MEIDKDKILELKSSLVSTLGVTTQGLGGLMVLSHLINADFNPIDAIKEDAEQSKNISKVINKLRNKDFEIDDKNLIRVLEQSKSLLDSIYSLIGVD